MANASAAWQAPSGQGHVPKPRAQPGLGTEQVVRFCPLGKTIHWGLYLPEGGSWRLARAQFPLYLWICEISHPLPNYNGAGKREQTFHSKGKKIELPGLNRKLRGSQGWQAKSAQGHRLHLEP